MNQDNLIDIEAAADFASEKFFHVREILLGTSLKRERHDDWMKYGLDVFLEFMVAPDVDLPQQTREKVINSFIQMLSAEITRYVVHKKNNVEIWLGLISNPDEALQKLMEIANLYQSARHRAYELSSEPVDVQIDVAPVSTEDLIKNKQERSSRADASPASSKSSRLPS